eukprot:1157263-Pelagomonas_calceolata.AAC.19
MSPVHLEIADALAAAQVVHPHWCGCSRPGSSAFGAGQQESTRKRNYVNRGNPPYIKSRKCQADKVTQPEQYHCPTNSTNLQHTLVTAKLST